MLADTNMAYTAKRNPTRCPTHPGALLRDDVIPATGRTKVEIAGLLGLGKLFGDGAGSGRGCRPPTLRGTRNAKRM
jgi:hypothetical protein